MTDQAPELLPCPFCGSKPVTERTGFSGRAMYVYCVNDNGCPRPKAIGETEEKAIENWNTRAPSERPVAQVREALEKLIAEFNDYHYSGCPGDYDANLCNCYAQAIIHEARAALTAERPSEAAVAWPSREAIAKVIEDNIYRKHNGNWDGDFQDLLIAADEIRALVIPHEEAGPETVEPNETKYWRDMYTDLLRRVNEGIVSGGRL